MQKKKFNIPDIFILEPKLYNDNRGVIFENFNHQRFESLINREVKFLQELHSFSYKNVLRGLHYQLSPMQQGKLIRVVRGEIFDVAVDIRKGSKTFGKWISQILSAENRKLFWIPEGFAHGFFVLSESADLLYKETNYYAPEYEACIKWDDKDLNIEWPSFSVDNLIMSEKDRHKATPFSEIVPL